MRTLGRMTSSFIAHLALPVVGVAQTTERGLKCRSVALDSDHNWPPPAPLEPGSGATECQGGPEGLSSRYRRSVKEVPKVFRQAGTELIHALVGLCSNAGSVTDQ